MNFIDNFLNKITMYRLVFYYLLALLVIAAIFSAFGILPYNPISLTISTLILVAACWMTNKIFAKILRVPANVESVYITAFILALIIPPLTLKPFDIGGFWFLIAAAVFAMASKYILAIYKKHIFNPAAFAVVLTGFVLGQYASWWIGGNLAMLAFVLIGGLLVARKIQRFDLVLTFFAAAIISILVLNNGFDPLTTIEKTFTHTCLLFFGFVMITEPLTTPPTRALRIIYGAIVGILFAPGIHIGQLYFSPEIALVTGNIFSYAVSPKKKYAMKLKSKEQIGEDIYNFTFDVKKMNFAPGQYMEFTLAAQGSDSRGNRRYFTVASSPTENNLQLSVKFYEKSSTFKKHMLELQPGDRMMGGQLAGDFTLPKDKNKKLVFIAGGIGITPFRSMIKYLSDSGEKRDIILLYSNRHASEIAYREIFDEAARTIGLKTIYVTTDTGPKIDKKMITEEIPDFEERMFYISGTRGMVIGLKRILHESGIHQNHVKVDFFPGFA